MRAIAIAFVLAALVDAPLEAFGPNAHRASARVAERHLTPAAARGVRELLGSVSLVEASTWADEIRSNATWAHASPWHYVTIEDGETYESSKKNPEGDLIVAIRRQFEALRDVSRPASERAIALRWVVHLVGDVHQPLHVGRGADRGGNEIDAEWFGRPTNLHSIWDTKLFESTELSFSELAEFIDTSDAKQVAAWQASEIMDWVRESMGYRERVYTVPEASYAGTYRYAYENLPLAKRRVAQAGVRLAGLLNSIFAEPETPAVWPIEYEARLRQAYELATQRLEARARAGELPEHWAVSLDLENASVGVLAGSYRALPGVARFAASVARLRGRLVIVGDAPLPVSDAMLTLERAGVTVDAHLFAKPEKGKLFLWTAVEEGGARPGLDALEIVLYLGSELADFPTHELDAFGRTYFILPKP